MSGGGGEKRWKGQEEKGRGGERQVMNEWGRG